MKTLVIFLFSIFLLTSCKVQDKEHAQLIDIETIKSDVIGKDVQLVDVRTLKGFSAGHIDDAINIDLLNEPLFNQKMSKLN